MLIQIPGEAPATEIARIITSAITPVFLLTGIGTYILILTNRLQRITDRVRGLVAHGDNPDLNSQLEWLARRGRLIRRGMTLLTISAHLVCVIVVILFLDFFFEWPVEWFVAGLFIGTVSLLAAALNCLLREVSLVGDGFPQDEP